MKRDTQNEMWFVLGTFPELSAAEISAVLNLQRDEAIFKPPFYIIHDNTLNAAQLIQRLGGTVKIASGLFKATNEDELVKNICANLSDISGKIVFGISDYSADARVSRLSEKIGKMIKKHLKEQGLSVRYVFNREPILSSVTVQKNGLTGRGREYIIIHEDNNYFVAKTEAIQPFEEWGQRDYGRPERDDVSGMLPPKLARIMLNLSKAKNGDQILDPFCGSGTIISEALSLGLDNLIGADKSEKAVADSITNIDWLTKRHPEYAARKIDIFSCDIADLPRRIGPATINTIITEPFLGKPLRGNESVKDIQLQAEELSHFYQQTILAFGKMLKKDGCAVMVIPRFRVKNEWVTLELSDVLSQAGLIPESLLKTENRTYDSLLYMRSNQRVGREIWRFRKD